MRTRTSTYPLRLPVSLKSAVEKLSKEDGTSINQFVVMAVAEKISALSTVAFFEERRRTADRAAFRRILDRKGGEAPQPEDTLPPGLGGPERNKGRRARSGRSAQRRDPAE